MKKLLFVIVATCMLLSVKAQEDKGKIALDFTFDPAAIFDANAGPMFQMPEIKARYFKSENFALRLGLNLSTGTNKTYTDTEGDTYVKNSSFLIAIAPGFEKHFGSGKFHPYVGAELPISLFSTAREEKDNIDTFDETGGSFGLELNAVLGFDYYVLPKFYVGAEFTPGFKFNKIFDQKRDGEVTEKGGYSTSFGLSGSSGLKIGVRF